MERTAASESMLEVGHQLQREQWAASSLEKTGLVNWPDHMTQWFILEFKGERRAIGRATGKVGKAEEACGNNFVIDLTSAKRP